MIHYHGTPITPEIAAAKVLAGHHAIVSFAEPRQIHLVSEVCQTFALDNGAFSAWQRGTPVVDWAPYYEWVKKWKTHPAFDFALIPDVIDGTERDNDTLITVWPLGPCGCPIWHLHESLQKLERLMEYWPRVALGSSGDFATIGTRRWWSRMGEAMSVVCRFGYPETKLHGLRMLDTEIVRHFPFSSADSCNVARNIGLDCKWNGSNSPFNKVTRAIVLAERIESVQSAARWVPMSIQAQLDFVEMFDTEGVEIL